MSAPPLKVDPSILGEYENHKYDNTPTKNDWHYVTISQVDDTTLKWTNRAGVSWKLTTTSDKTILDTGSDSPYFARGQKQVTVLWEGDRVTGLTAPPPWDELFEKDQEHPANNPDINPSKVFDELVAGHKRYKAGQMEHPHTGQNDMEKLASGQTPKACILGCADSRVPPEIIFDQGLGDLFVVRVAGNFADDDNQASLEYAVQHFDPPPALIIVLGHEKCGAIQGAAISFDPESVRPKDVEKFSHHPASEKLVALVTRLKPAIDSTKQSPQPATDEEYTTRMDEAVRQNVKDNVAILQANEEIKESGAFVIGARYDLDSGEIEWLTPKPNGSIE